MGDRGASERYANIFVTINKLTDHNLRAMLWSEYLAEEIFTDKDDWTIAKECTGTRTGLRGQTNRCSFVEFLEHLWTPTENSVNGNVLDPHMPDKTKYLWDIDLDKVETMNQEKIAKGIENIYERGQREKKPKLDADGNIIFKPPNAQGKKYPELVETDNFKRGPKLKPGFTGWLNVANLNGGSDFFSSIKEAGKAIANVKGEIDSLDNEEDKKKFQFHIENAENAADRTIDLRYLEMGQVILDPKKGLQKHLGITVLEQDPKPKGPYGTKYRWPDKDKTCSSEAAKIKFGSEEDARTAYDEAWDDLSAADGDGQHQKAVDALQGAKNNMVPAGSCSG